MSDWTESEFKSALGYIPLSGDRKNPTIFNTTDIPTHVDWRESLQSMKVIKNQGHCGSCWAFSTIGSLEAKTEIAGFGYQSLSEQQLVDCVPLAFGCNGGNYMTGFEYLKTAGSQTEKTYPYLAVDQWHCDADPKLFVNKHLTNWEFVNPFSSADLRAAVAVGPVSISIQADQDAFRNYKTGVVKIADCGEQLNHAVLAIGYGTENGTDYFLVRNSWSNTWGDNGTVKLEATATDCACGCVSDPAFAIVA